jgi:hypothetical protein
LPPPIKKRAKEARENAREMKGYPEAFIRMMAEPAGH